MADRDQGRSLDELYGTEQSQQNIAQQPSPTPATDTEQRGDPGAFALAAAGAGRREPGAVIVAGRRLRLGSLDERQLAQVEHAQQTAHRMTVVRQAAPTLAKDTRILYEIAKDESIEERIGDVADAEQYLQLRAYRAAVEMMEGGEQATYFDSLDRKVQHALRDVGYVPAAERRESSGFRVPGTGVADDVWDATVGGIQHNVWEGAKTVWNLPGAAYRTTRLLSDEEGLAAVLGPERSFKDPGTVLDAWRQAWDGERLFDPKVSAEVEEMFDDPEAFQLVRRIALGENPAELALTFAEPGTPEYQDAYVQVQEFMDNGLVQEALRMLGGRAKISPGRDLARSVGLEDGTPGFTVLSGAGDAAFQIYTDPLLILGKARKGYLFRKYSIVAGDGLAADRVASMYGADILERATARAVTDVKDPKYWGELRRFHGTNIERAAVAVTDHVTQGRIWQLMAARPDLRPMLQPLVAFEREGGLTNVEDLVQWFRSQAGLETLARGGVNNYLEDFVTLPRLGRFSTVKVQAKLDLNKVVDWAQDVSIGVRPLNAEHAVGELDDQLANTAQVWLGKAANLKKRLTTLTPHEGYLAFHDRRTPETLARLLDFGPLRAAEREAMFDTFMRASDDATRIVTMHGYYRTLFANMGILDDPRYADFVSAWLNTGKQRYSIGNIDVIPSPTGPMAAGLWPGVDRAHHMAIPNFRDVLMTVQRNRFHDVVTKGINHRWVDNAMKVWKPLVILRPAFAIRAGGEEMLSQLARWGVLQPTKQWLLVPLAGKRTETPLWLFNRLHEATRFTFEHTPLSVLRRYRDVPVLANAYELVARMKRVELRLEQAVSGTMREAAKALVTPADLRAYRHLPLAGVNPSFEQMGGSATGIQGEAMLAGAPGTRYSFDIGSSDHPELIKLRQVGSDYDTYVQGDQLYEPMLASTMEHVGRDSTARTMMAVRARSMTTDQVSHVADELKRAGIRVGRRRVNNRFVGAEPGDFVDIARRDLEQLYVEDPDLHRALVAAIEDADWETAMVRAERSQSEGVKRTVVAMQRLTPNERSSLLARSEGLLPDIAPVDTKAAVGQAREALQDLDGELDQLFVVDIVADWPAPPVGFSAADLSEDAHEALRAPLDATFLARLNAAGVRWTPDDVNDMLRQADLYSWLLDSAVRSVGKASQRGVAVQAQLVALADQRAVIDDLQRLAGEHGVAQAGAELLAARRDRLAEISADWERHTRTLANPPVDPGTRQRWEDLLRRGERGDREAALELEQDLAAHAMTHGSAADDARHMVRTSSLVGVRPDAVLREVPEDLLTKARLGPQPMAEAEQGVYQAAVAAWRRGTGEFPYTPYEKLLLELKPYAESVNPHLAPVIDEIVDLEGGYNPGLWDEIDWDEAQRQMAGQPIDTIDHDRIEEARYHAALQANLDALLDEVAAAPVGITYEQAIRDWTDKQSQALDELLLDDTRSPIQWAARPLAEGTFDRRRHLTNVDVQFPSIVHGPRLEQVDESLTLRLVNGAFNNLGAQISAIARQPLWVRAYADSIADAEKLVAPFMRDAKITRKADGVLRDLDEASDTLFVLTHTRQADNSLRYLDDISDDELAGVLVADNLLPDGFATFKPELKTELLDDVRKWWRMEEKVQERMASVAASYALEKTLPYIDDHRIRSQMAEYGRNLVPFWFAEEQFLKRWARTIRHSPESLRRLELYHNGLTSIGWLDTDDRGETVFVYPGSAQAIKAVTRALDTLPGDARWSIPMAVEMTGQLKYAAPGFDRMGIPSPGPAVAIPMSVLRRLYPDIGLPLEAQVMGSRGQLRSLPDLVVPAVAMRTFRALTARDEDMAMSVMAAMQYLEANHPEMVPDEDATDDERETYYDTLTNHARILQLAQAMGGFVGPASPSIDLDPDDLNPELRELMSSGVGIEEAFGIYLKRNPDATPYTVFRSEVVGKAPLNPSDAVAEALLEHEDFYNRYKRAGGWLLPQSDDTETMNRNAFYQLSAMGYRRVKGVDEFYNDLQFAKASDLYFDSAKEKDVALAAATTPERRKAIKASWKAWTDDYFAKHPIFARMLRSSEGRDRRNAILLETEKALADPDVPDFGHVDELRTLIDSYRRYEQEVERSLAAPQGGSEKARARRKQMKVSFANWAEAWSATHPTVLAFYQRILMPDLQLPAASDEDEEEAA